MTGGIERELYYLLVRIRGECERQTHILSQLQIHLLDLKSARAASPPPASEPAPQPLGIFSKLSTADVIKLSIAGVIVYASLSGQLDVLRSIANFAK